MQLGAAVRYGEIAAEPLAGWLPALAQAARTVGSPQIWAAATRREPGNVLAGG